MKLNIVLFEPEIPPNVGNIARTCAATGARLYICGNISFDFSEKHLKRAGLDYWPKMDVIYYSSVERFLDNHLDKNLFFFTTKAQKDYCTVDYTEIDEIFLIFGRETRGIDEEILVKYPQQCVRIPMLEDIRSLNLSNSVAIAVYEVLRQKGFEKMERSGHLHRLSWI